MRERRKWKWEPPEPSPRRAIFVTLYWDERVVAARRSAARRNVRQKYFAEWNSSRSRRDTRGLSRDARAISLDFPHEQTYPSWDLATNRKFVSSSRLNASSHRQYFIGGFARLPLFRETDLRINEPSDEEAHIVFVRSNVRELQPRIIASAGLRAGYSCNEYPVCKRIRYTGKKFH